MGGAGSTAGSARDPTDAQLVALDPVNTKWRGVIAAPANVPANEVDAKRGELKAQRLERKAATAERGEDTTESSAPSVVAPSAPRPAVSPREFFDDASGFAKRRIDGVAKSFQNK